MPHLLSHRSSHSHYGRAIIWALLGAFSAPEGKRLEAAVRLGIIGPLLERPEVWAELQQEMLRLERAQARQRFPASLKDIDPQVPVIPIGAVRQVHLEADAEWRQVIAPPSIVLILGKMVSGKSAVGYRLLEMELESLVVPQANAAEEAGKLLHDLPGLWAAATLPERRRLLLTMVDAVYVDAKEEKRIVAIRPKLPFRPVFQVATTKEGSGIILLNGPPESHPEAPSCFWWRWGRRSLYRKHDVVLIV